MLTMLVEHPILFRILFYSVPVLTFAFGMLAMYIVKVKKPINYKRLMDVYLGSRVGQESCENVFGINTITLHKELGKNFQETPYHIYFVDRFGESHEVTHAQMESKGLGNGLTLYSIKPHEYNSKGKYIY
jgi:hypothetical protein